MKQPERVAELLAELRALAETDFERHRLDVLERDLTDPPTVEVIDDTHQRFNGITFAIDAFGHYHNKFPMHRAVWLYYRGEIPSGYHIHHIDENKSNNNIENLQALTHSEHSSIHAKPPTKKVCPICGKSFVSAHKNQVFCSVICKVKHQKKNLEERICPVCGTHFLIKHSSKQVCCSRACSCLHEPKPMPPRKCVMCGKEFTPSKFHPQKCTCSSKCRAQFVRHGTG